MYYCGWDGGGSKTEVCITDEQGTIVAEASFGSLNLNGSTPEKVNATIKDCLAFMQSITPDLNNFNALVVGLAGISNHTTSATVEKAIRNNGYNGRLKLIGDHEAALSGAIKKQGAILIAGTGSICHGRNSSNECFRCGGYGHLIDDEGSGYAIGRDILKAVAKAHDGRNSKTVLTDLVFKHLNLADHNSLIAWVYADTTTKKDIASLTPLLSEALMADDAAAKAIARKCAEELSALAISLFQKANITHGEIALMGSIFKYFDCIKNLTIDIIKKELPEVQIIEPRHKAARGAANMAKEILNI